MNFTYMNHQHPSKSNKPPTNLLLYLSLDNLRSNNILDLYTILIQPHVGNPALSIGLHLDINNMPMPDLSPIKIAQLEDVFPTSAITNVQRPSFPLLPIHIHQTLISVTSVDNLVTLHGFAYISRLQPTILLLIQILLRIQINPALHRDLNTFVLPKLIRPIHSPTTTPTQHPFRSLTTRRTATTN
jgi:hypothetical protein